MIQPKKMRQLLQVAGNVRGRCHLIPKDPDVLAPNDLTPLTAEAAPDENSAQGNLGDNSSYVELNAGTASGGASSESNEGAQSGLMEINSAHE
jgi:hypothetical protein